MGFIIFLIGLQALFIWLGLSNGWWFLWLPALIWMISTITAVMQGRLVLTKEQRAMGFSDRREDHAFNQALADHYDKVGTSREEHSDSEASYANVPKRSPADLGYSIK